MISGGLESQVNLVVYKVSKSSLIATSYSEWFFEEEAKINPNFEVVDNPISGRSRVWS